MWVELRGGPRDGEMMEVSDGRLEIAFYVKPPVSPYESLNLAIYETDTVRTAIAPILRSNGRYYVDVPKETYLA